jgi:predicted glutamine amidotransferase
MCRLFGLTAGDARVRATFWLLDAPDSLEAQSHRNADGSGIGFFAADGSPVLDKRPEPAFSDPQFIHEAKDVESNVFVAHIRYATTGERSVANTHPFAMDGRIMAHNGGFGDLGRLEAQLGPYLNMVHGQTDSERYFALMTQQIDEHDGDVGAGISAAARWIGANLPVTALNTVVAAGDELWALRYPDVHALHVIERPAGASTGELSGKGMQMRSATSSFHCEALDDAGSVVVASERLDGETGWRMLAPGELVHVRPDLSVESVIAVPDPPARLVPLSDPDHNIET